MNPRESTVFIVYVTPQTLHSSKTLYMQEMSALCALEVILTLALFRVLLFQIRNSALGKQSKGQNTIGLHPALT